ncbi:HAMP domain-containing sensor histidine kinase [Hydrogenoanaerobacterium sp.]|uniref:sensor histidine kinase n=1 Tax=Hydrogenoanaerobacterium sp. TaxID=2953763 RepID=UPI00289FCD15|nr:HAMP domain-containing sensor histidine kinase [Hydrogenoanaerobacterium sp.]
MQKSLLSKYFTVCSAIILVSITILGLILMVFAAQYFKLDKQKLLMRNASQALSLTEAEYKRNGYKEVNSYTLKAGYTILGNAIDATIFLTDPDGKTLLCTETGACSHFTYIIPQSVRQKLENEGEYKEMGKLGGIYKNNFYTVAVPLKHPTGQSVAYIFVSSSASGLQYFLAEILNMFAISSLAVIVISFIVIYFVTSRMVKPLREMVGATQSFAKGDFTVRVPVTSYDEVGQLAIAFNNMATSLASTESVRRSFIGNVSHELKTPMTTIAGFIDGILDGTITEDKRDKYLRIVSDEVNRLSRLVRSMLNIARMESGELKLAPADFDINETICTTVFTFEQQIENKQLEIRGLDQGKFMVSADCDLIHQVVYNLIDNAVKFVNEGGYIEFRYRTEGGFTYIGIRNSGDGIPKEEIPHVFEKFYKSDRSRSLDKNGVGLGLHIVRTIINLHSGDIYVRSVEGEYCEFEFTLPTAKTSKGLLRKGSQS